MSAELVRVEPVGRYGKGVEVGMEIEGNYSADAPTGRARVTRSDDGPVRPGVGEGPCCMDQRAGAVKLPSSGFMRRGRTSGVQARACGSRP